MDKVNKTQIKLWRALKKYGFNNFKIEILEDGLQTQKEMDDRECYWIEKFNCLKEGYNCRHGGSRGSHTEEAKRKIGEANRNRSEELKRKIIETRRKNGNLKQTEASKKKNRQSNARYEYTITHPDGNITKTKSLTEFCEIHNLNKQSMHKMASGRQKFYGDWKVSRQKLKNAKGIRVLTEEQKENLSKSRKGKKRSTETIEKMKKAAKEREITDEHREILRQNGLKSDHKKIGEMLRGRTVSKETREKLSKSLKGKKPWNTGKKLSEDHKKKISEYNKGRVGPMKGKKHSDEAKRKIQEASCKYEYTLVSPDGEIFVTKSLNQFCKEHGLILNCILVMIKGKQKQHKGWTCTRKSIDD